MEFWNSIYPYLIGLGVAAITFASTWFVTKFKSWGINLSEKFRDKVLDVIKGLAKEAIDIVSQKFVDDLKKAGKWIENRDSNVKTAITMGVDTLKTLMPKAYLTVLGKLYGDVDKFLENTIELELKQKPNNQPVA